MTMRKSAKTFVLVAVAVVAGGVGLFWSGEITPTRISGLVTQARAIIGMPLTPMSYAGVARRTIY
jgi:hypothetical protein